MNSFRITSSVNAQPYPKSPEPWREEYNIVLDSFTFSHPMTVINKTELTGVREKIQAGYPEIIVVFPINKITSPVRCRI